MRFEEFEETAREAFEEIPEEYRAGVDGLTVRREALGHPTLPEVFTLGHCITEEHISDYGGPDTTRSTIALYWGSFRELAERDPDFDWDAELWETLTHELRHHLESLAGDDALEDADYAADQLFKRQDGVAFDPWYYQYGEDLGGGVFAVERGLYLEKTWDPRAVGKREHLDFDWRGARYRVGLPSELGDVTFLLVGGSDFRDEDLEVVLVRTRRWWERLAALFTRSEDLRVMQEEARAVRVGEGA